MRVLSPTRRRAQPSTDEQKEPLSPTRRRSCGAANEQDRRSYWSHTSPSSPSHILQTPHHALFALFGAAGFASFSFALVQQKPFDATLAAVLVMLCLYIYTLHSERCQRKSEWRESFAGVSVLSSSPKGSKAGIRAGAARAAADGTSELDLTGYAKTLGVSIRNGVVHKEGSTLNKLLMDALAKEYLRCVSALRCYQSAFGPLQEDDLPEKDDGAAQSRTVDEHSGPDPLTSTMNSLNLAMDLAALAEPATTPRSPGGMQGPPSPDPKRCRVNSGITPEGQGPATPVLAGLISTPAPAAPSNTPKTADPDNATGWTQPPITAGDPVLETVSSNVWSMEEVKSAAFVIGEPASDSHSGPKEEKQEKQPVAFGLFGSSRRSGTVDSL